MQNDRDEYNLCITLFIERDYDSAFALGEKLCREKTTLELFFVLMLLALHLHKTDLVEKLANHLRNKARLSPLHAAVLDHLQGANQPDELLALATSDADRCRALFYIGARHELNANFELAHTAFKSAATANSNSLERMISNILVEHYRRFTWGTSSPLPQAQSVPYGQIPDLGVLLAQLNNEHRTSYVYRGQIKDYGSLLPSGYRSLVNTKFPLIGPVDGTALHNRGLVFRCLAPNSLWPESGRKEIDFVSLCRAQLGYPLSQLFCQHCQLPTEGIDVTRDISVAALFAIYDFARDSYVNSADEYGVIYRIDISDAGSPILQDLKRMDFYNCAFFLDGAELLSRLGKCEDLHDTLVSFQNYFSRFLEIELDMTSFETWNDVRANRPIELLQFSERDIDRSRLRRQQAGLVFPDSLLPRTFQALSTPPPADKTWEGPHCIEDLAFSDRIETFYFRHTPNNRDVLTLNPQTIFPQEDPIVYALSHLISTMSAGSGARSLVHQDTSVFEPGDEHGLPK